MQVKKLGYILFVGVIATICILPVAVMPWQTEKAVGNEQLASFPELRKEDGSFNTGILNEFSDYFADHFGLRHEMITLNDQLTGTVLKTLDSSSVLLGKDDWLFYKSTLADYTGAELFTARQSYAAAHVLGLMQEYCEENGIGFCFTIAPNKNSLYGGQMPARYTAASVRNAQLLQQQMEQQNVRYVDLFKTLSDHEERLYYRRDSHWNMRGAQLAAQTLLKELKGSEAEFDSCINGKTSPHTGDLYEMVYPAGNETEQDTAYDFTYQYDEKFHSADDITIHTENSGGRRKHFCIPRFLWHQSASFSGTELRQRLFLPEYALPFDGCYRRAARCAAGGTGGKQPELAAGTRPGNACSGTHGSPGSRYRYKCEGTTEGQPNGGDFLPDRRSERAACG